LQTYYFWDKFLCIRNLQGSFSTSIFPHHITAKTLFYGEQICRGNRALDVFLLFTFFLYFTARYQLSAKVAFAEEFYIYLKRDAFNIWMKKFEIILIIKFHAVSQDMS